MEQVFTVNFGSSSVGQAEVTKMGLYYHIRCRCRFEIQGIYKLEISGTDGKMNLGTCIPVEGGYALDKKIPIKSVGSRILSIAVSVPENGRKECIMPVSDSEPFAYISQVQNGALVKRNGGMGILLTKKDHSSVESVNPTGQ